MYDSFQKRTMDSPAKKIKKTRINFLDTSEISNVIPSKKIKYQIKSYNKNKHWKNVNQVNITTVKNLNVGSLRIPRAGFFIYTVFNGRLFIGCGVDSRNHELTDFAGQVIYKIGETVIHGALREFKEETQEIFSTLTTKDIENCLTIYDNNNLVIFMNINIHPDIISQEFNEKYQASAVFKPEVCAITWLTVQEFNDIINNDNGIMYERVQKFLKLAGDFTNLL
jgi:hypothetical protein